MRILHTSDWHIGHKHYGRQRHHEFPQFFDWLIETIDAYEVEALIVAGDIFNSQTPSNRSLKLYYRFLSRISNTCCRNVVITGGNHDSPALLNGPQELLHFLNIHVIGRAADSLENEIIVLEGKDNRPGLMVLAVPYLRDRDIRQTEAGESPGDKQNKLLQGISNHYERLCVMAQEKQAHLETAIPLLATGHLFCQGGTTRQGDGVRELYVGTLVQVGLDTFPADINYLALGHLHLPQKVAGHEYRRYSGAPLAMSFNEADEQKVVLLVDMATQPVVTEIPVPCFQALAKITGSCEQILEHIATLARKNKAILLEINYQGQTLVDDLQEQIHSAIEDTELTVLRISNKRIFDHILQRTAKMKTLEELSPRQVFQQCLDLHEISGEQQDEMILDFETALTSLNEKEQNVE
jgi:DNA repair protein SbcD/Mre11